MRIKPFNQFVNEELTNIQTYKSNTGTIKSFDKIYSDENPNPKSLASGLLLKKDYHDQELEDLYDVLGLDKSLAGTAQFYKVQKNPKELEKLKVRLNNLKFLKYKLKELGELRCEYCNKGPLFIYDFTKRKGDPEFIDNKHYKYKEEFKEEDGATCDHKNPQGKGGDKFGYDNLAVCCYKCNQNKKSMSYEDWMKKINKTFENSDVLIKFNDYIPDRHSIKILKERN